MQQACRGSMFAQSTSPRLLFDHTSFLFSKHAFGLCESFPHISTQKYIYIYIYTLCVYVRMHVHAQIIYGYVRADIYT